MLFNSRFFMGAMPLAAQAEAQPNPLASFIPIILIFVIMYMLLIRPQQKKNKEHQEMIKKVKAGDRVVTAGGIHGQVTKVKDRTLTIRVADKVEIEFSRVSVASIQDGGASDSATKQ